MGDFIFKSGGVGAPWGGINFGGGWGSKKIVRWGVAHAPSTMGKPARNIFRKNCRVDKYLRTYEKTVL